MCIGRELADRHRRLFGTVEIAYFGANVTRSPAAAGCRSASPSRSARHAHLADGPAHRHRTRTEMEGPLQELLDEVQERSLVRVRARGLPHRRRRRHHALRANVAINHGAARARRAGRPSGSRTCPTCRSPSGRGRPVGAQRRGIVHIDLRFGLPDDRTSRHHCVLPRSAEEELDFEPDDATYSSRASHSPRDAPGMPRGASGASSTGRTRGPTRRTTSACRSTGPS